MEQDGILEEESELQFLKWKAAVDMMIILYYLKIARDIPSAIRITIFTEKYEL